MVIGDNDWTLPIPIVKAGTAWRFDGVAGQQGLSNDRPPIPALHGMGCAMGAEVNIGIGYRRSGRILAKLAN